MVSLIKDINEKIESDETEQLEKSLKKGRMNLQTMLLQFRQVKKMGGISSIVSMLPGMSSLKDKMENSGQIDELKRNEAIILSMTMEERLIPEILNASRKKRIATGAGTDVMHINTLLKQHKRINKLMKKFTGIDKGQLSQALKSFNI